MERRVFNLLIIDNEPGDWVEVVNQSLHTSIPYRISVAGNLKDGLALFSTNDFDAVAADYILPDGYCIDIIPAIKQIPLIVMTTEGNEESVLRALDLGAVEYIIKDNAGNFKKSLHITLNKSIRQKSQSIELEKYRNQLELIVEERTVELIEMYNKLQKSEVNFRNIFNGSKDAIIIVDHNYDYVKGNDALFKLLGVNSEFLHTHVLMDYIMPDFRPFLIEMLEQVKIGNPADIMELEVISPSDSSLLNIEISSVPIIYDNKKAILCIIRDIRERKNHARKIFETVILTEEVERNRLARDLHDEIGPLISALKIFTNSFLETDYSGKKNKLAQQIGNIVRDVIDAIKIISNDMSPHVLLNFGLSAAVQNFAGLFSKDYDINIKTNTKGIRFPKTVEVLLYRVIKELINNTVKHARANTIDIELDYKDKMLMCRYSDDGIGFNWNEKVDSPGNGMGLNNIISRISALGGNFTVNSADKKGFHISFELQTITRNDSGKEI